MTTWKPDRPRRSEIDPRPVVESLERVARRLGAPPIDVLATLFGRWADLVGPTVAAHATPRTLRRGVLTVEADSPAWATQLRLLSGDLRRRVLDELPGAEVTEVVVTVRRR